MNGQVDPVRELVRDAAAGEPDAWEALYRRVYARLFTYARRRLACDAEADDAVSEAMSRAMARIAGFTWRGAGFDAWMYGILRNVVRETYRGRVRTTPLARLADDGAASPINGTAPEDPADVLAARVDTAILREAFERLRPSDQEVLELRIVGELSVDEVGTVIGKRSGAVRMAQSRAVRRLRGLVEEVRGG